MSEQTEKSASQGEISLKDLILTGKAYFFEVLRNFLLIGLITLPVLAYFYYQYAQTPTTYSDRLTFMVNSEDGNSMSSVASILGQFGLGGGGRSRHNLDKILELSKSGHIIGQVLLERVELNGQSDLLINHFINHYQWDQEWAKNNPDIEGFRFTSDSISHFSLQEGKYFKRVFRIIVGGEEPGLLTSSYSEESSIMRLNATTTNELLTYSLLNLTFEKLSEFYVNKTIEKQKTTFDLVSSKKDSIYDALRTAEYNLANFRETNRNLIDSRSKLTEIRLQREMMVLSQVYAEAVKNTEISDFTLKNTTPFVQMIDQPILPIRGDRPSLIMTLVKGILLGGILGVLFVLGRKVIRDTMAEED